MRWSSRQGDGLLSLSSPGPEPYTTCVDVNNVNFRDRCQRRPSCGAASARANNGSVGPLGCSNGLIEPPGHCETISIWVPSQVSYAIGSGGGGIRLNTSRPHAR